MKTQQNINSYMWRPNDNSVSTKIKYDLEAEHWVDSVNAAQRYANRGASTEEVTAIVGGIFAILIGIIYFVGLFFKFLYRWVFQENKNSEPLNEKGYHSLTNEEMELLRKSFKKNKPYDLYGKQTLEEYGWYN